MGRHPLLRGLSALALTSLVSLSAQSQPRTIPSLTEPGEGLTIRAVSAHGVPTFASTPGRGILLRMSASATAETRALAFIESYGSAFGLKGAQMRLARASAADSSGVEHVRLQQTDQGVPVRGGDFIVHLKGARVLVANGHTLDDLPTDVSPAIAASIAALDARQVMEKHRPDDAVGAVYSEPRLEIFNRALLSDVGTHRTALAWFIEAKSPTMRELIWIDAKTGAILLHFDQLAKAKSRTIYNGNHTNVLPGILVRSEGGPATGDADEDNAYTYAGATYDYYLTNHGRDSFDNAGGDIASTCHYCTAPYCPSYQNAFWNGDQMVYGDGFASADDVVGHELTHAVTERSANLFYYVQSGALNESFSDIFGETIDLTDGLGNDTAGVRWKLGEDLAIGAIRDMMTPNNFSDPGRVGDSAYFVCSDEAWTDTSDGGGVHTNSGVPNHAYALMVDGGTYNGKTITGIGLTKAAKIEYRALTTYLTSGSGFLDDYNALNQSCTDLIGTAGITSGDCTQVDNALLAVEMNNPWPCAGATQAPALCAAGAVSTLAVEGFEGGLGTFTATNSTGSWLWGLGVAKSGVYMAWGTDEESVSDHKLTLTSAATIPAGGRLYFDHAFEFESSASTFNYDGGVVEYSTNGGSSWTDAGSLIDAGQNYNGTVHSCCLNPLAARTAFVRSSYGYTGTRLNLASLAGQNVQFRFRVGTDFSFGSLGWMLDNVRIYSCTTNGFTDDPLVALTTLVKRIHIVELRSRIDALRVAHGLGAFSWTDPTITVGSTGLKAVHITDMRTALAQAYTAASVTPPTYTDPGLSSGTLVKKVHIDQLRAAVIALE